jgi:L-2-hydroxyglutarate oxidase LhgO
VTHIGIVGAGIIGLAVARELAARHPGTSITVLDKEDRVAAHQTGRNSGVVHAGIYYAPGSLKARLCTRGMRALRAYCWDRGLPYEQCGKLIVALDEAEIGPLEELHRRGAANGVEGLRIVDAAGIRAIEPESAGIMGLHSPETAITSFTAITESFADDLRAAGGQVLLRQEVSGIAAHGQQVVARTGTGEHAFDQLVVCAGLHADRLATLIGEPADPQIVPFRGDYFVLRPERRGLVNGLIYPVPDPRYPFLGIHLTRRIDGEVLVGPNAVLAFAREGYHRATVRPGELGRTLAWRGFRRMARQHWRTGAKELYRSFSKAAFVREARRYVPALRSDDVTRGPSGIRAQAIEQDGSLVDDFRISRQGRVVVIRNAPSPAATSSMAIAEHICDQLGDPG